MKRACWEGWGDKKEPSLKVKVDRGDGFLGLKSDFRLGTSRFYKTNRLVKELLEVQVLLSLVSRY